MIGTASKYWKKVLSEKEIFDLIKRTVYKTIPRDEETAEKALSYVLEKMVKDNYKLLQSYDPRRSDVKPFLYFTTCRVLRDFWKYYKPPARLLKIGNTLFIMVHKMLCWQRFSPDFIVEHYVDLGMAPERVWEAIWFVRENFEDCGQSKFEEVSVEDMDIEPEIYKDNIKDDPINIMILMQLINIVGLIFGENTQTVLDHSLLSPKLRRLIVELETTNKLSDVERRFLRLVYQDGMKVGHAGKIVGLKGNKAKEKHKQIKDKLRRRIPKSLLQELLACLKN